jgi:hypothetical protein
MKKLVLTKDIIKLMKIKTEIKTGGGSRSGVATGNGASTAIAS